VAMFCFKNLEMNHMDFFVTTVQEFATKRNSTKFSNFKSFFCQILLLNENKTWPLHIQTLVAQFISCQSILAIKH
jgi:hypothetical protein